MTSAILSDIEVAAAPAAIAILQAAQTLVTNIGSDPTKWALTFPGALTVFVGTVQLQLPSVAVAEGALIQSQAVSHIGALISDLQAKIAAAAPAPAVAAK